MLGTVASASILPLSKNVKSCPARDPAFAAIAAHKAALEAWVDAYNVWDEARVQAYQSNGNPHFTIRWRDRDVNFGNLETVREVFDRGPEIFRDLVQVEYDRMYRKLIALRSHERTWEREHGIRKLKLAQMHASWALTAADIELGETKPTSAAGAAALLEYVLSDSCQGDSAAMSEYHCAAIRNVAAFLQTPSPKPASATASRAA